MKRLALLGAAALVTSSTAWAADLPMRMAPPAFVPPPIFTWTGGYFGINGGYDFDNKTRFTQSNGTLSAASSGVGINRPARVTVSDDGFSAGGQFGYNYQFGALGTANLVLGLEADVAYTDISKTVTVDGVNTAGAVTPNTFSAKLDYLGTARGRIGLAFNRMLVYATGGFAYGEVESSVNYFNPNGASRFYGSTDKIRTGWTAGGGVEYALPTESFLNFFHSSAVTVKAEYLYYELDGKNFGLPAVAGGGGTGTYASRTKTEGNIARVGLNYKFGTY